MDIYLHVIRLVGCNYSSMHWLHKRFIWSVVEVKACMSNFTPSLCYVDVISYPYPNRDAQAYMEATWIKNCALNIHTTHHDNCSLDQHHRQKLKKGSVSGEKLWWLIDKHDTISPFLGSFLIPTTSGNMTRCLFSITTQRNLDLC